MKKYYFKMNVFTIFTMLTLINVCRSETWQTRYREKEWSVFLVKRAFNQSIAFSVSERYTLTGCLFWCTLQIAETGLSLYYEPVSRICYCNTHLDIESEDLYAKWIFYGRSTNLLEIEGDRDSTYIRTTVWPYKTECLDLLNDGFLSDGIYSIIPVNDSRLFVFCDMINGGWTIIQRRFDGSVDFYRNWNDYRNGFGSKIGEYWLGLETIHRLTKDGSELTVYMEAYPGNSPLSMTAHYSYFSVGDHLSSFRMHVYGFLGTCEDSLSYSHGSAFSTYDNDNDISALNCAVYYRTAGWFRTCFAANFNGRYFKEGEYSNTYLTQGIHWTTCWEGANSQKSLLLKIRRI